MNFTLEKVTKMELSSQNNTVFDLTVEHDHSYCANGIVVHNSVCTTRIKTGI